MAWPFRPKPPPPLFELNGRGNGPAIKRRTFFAASLTNEEKTNKKNCKINKKDTYAL